GCSQRSAFGFIAGLTVTTGHARLRLAPLFAAGSPPMILCTSSAQVAPGPTLVSAWLEGLLKLDSLKYTNPQVASLRGPIRLLPEPPAGSRPSRSRFPALRAFTVAPSRA